ncbi:MAG: nuclear transport factor 2 family protein [Myxococcales bacterium]|nr:nuclear transport factor 2 family protein [Myxococcales bacterium]
MPRIGALWALCVLAPGCRNESPQDPQPSSAADEPAPTGAAAPGSAADAVPSPPGAAATGEGLAAAVETLLRPDVRQVQERLAEVLKVARRSGEPPSAIAWAVPPCPLRYEFQADVTMSTADLPLEIAGEQGLRVAGDFTMQAGDGGRVVIHNGELELSQVMAGVKHPGGKEEPGALAEIRLERDGPQWKEVDGPTVLWSAYGSFPGLVEFWPALPSALAPGGRGSWALTIHGQGSGLEVETTRGTRKAPEGFEFPPPTPQVFDAEVEVQGWLDVEGQPAVVLVSQWNHDDEGSIDPAVPKGEVPELDVDVSIEARSRYVVLATGRLLWADVHHVTDVEMGMGGQSMKQHHDLRATARLVEACDGPVMVEPAPAPSPEEGALEAFALLRNAVVGGDSEAMVRHLAPELSRAHDKDSIARLLVDHVARFGPFSLGTPELTLDVRRDGDRVRMHMTGSARNEDGSTMTVHTVAWAQTRDGRATIESIGTDTVEREEGWSVLELSPTRMASGDLE